MDQTKKKVPFVSVALCLISVVVTAGVIYLTPLKWVTVIEPTIKDIDPQEFYSEFSVNPEKFIFIDVRSESAYQKLHAKGSLNLPLHTLYDQRHILPKEGKEIVLICSGGRASGVGYSYLQHYGFFNIHRIEGGIEGWASLNLPTESLEIPEATTTLVSSVEYPCFL